MAVVDTSTSWNDQWHAESVENDSFPRGQTLLQRPLRRELAAGRRAPRALAGVVPSTPREGAVQLEVVPVVRVAHALLVRRPVTSESRAGSELRVDRGGSESQGAEMSAVFDFALPEF